MMKYQIFNNDQNYCLNSDNVNNPIKPFDIHIASGSEFDEDEVGWDLPLIQLENDLHPSTRSEIPQFNNV